ncbi:MAG: PmbA/TldA family metallopeptidase, partial [Alphaproteobacteria bacterium]
MNALGITDELFFTLLDRAGAERQLRDATAGCEDGELFLEYRESEAISLDDGRIRSASYDATRGFGLRAVAGEAAGFAHAGELSDASLSRYSRNSSPSSQPCVASRNWRSAPARSSRVKNNSSV